MDTQSTEIVGIEWLLKLTVRLNATANTILMQNAYILARLEKADPNETTNHWFAFRDQVAEQKYQDVKADLTADLSETSKKPER